MVNNPQRAPITKIKRENRTTRLITIRKAEAQRRASHAQRVMAARERISRADRGAIQAIRVAGRKSRRGPNP